LNNVTREYNRAIEEIALTERKVKEQAATFPRKVFGWLRGLALRVSERKKQQTI
jgi:hypothetical protein